MDPNDELEQNEHSDQQDTEGAAAAAAAENKRETAPSDTDTSTATGEGSAAAGTEGEGGGTDDGEVAITIGDAAPAAEDDGLENNASFREVRNALRESQRRERELRQQLEKSGTAAEPREPTLGAEPTMESCDFDEARFKVELLDWNKRKDALAAKADQQRQAQKAEGENWQKTLTTYGEQKTALKVRDFAGAELRVQEALNVTQQGVLLHACENAAVVVAGLGGNAEELKKLAAITDPIKFTAAIVRLEAKMKVTPRKTVPPPERRASGGAPAAASTSEQTLARLEAEADRTGDRSKVIAYKRQLKQTQKAAA